MVMIKFGKNLRFAFKTSCKTVKFEKKMPKSKNFKRKKILTQL